MTEEQKRWFEDLAKDRLESARVLEKDSMSGIKKSVVEKYSDNAHFIYELLQNASDAKATKSSFRLTADGLYFKHNGEIFFSLSDPKIEKNDKENGKLGHINSITAIAFSNKQESSIGKFGVGFKAVYQYTDTPYIYDPNFKFKIDRFIIPVLLDEDLPERNQNETVFYLPFNKSNLSKDEAYSDILEKLKKLEFPTLFLPSLEIIEWNSVNETGKYSKKTNQLGKVDDIIYEYIELTKNNEQKESNEKLYLFSRLTEDDHSYSIGYFVNEENKLIPKQLPAFCYFPTREVTNLNFILHAPFLLTDGRETIKRSEYNSSIVDLLAILAADSLMILKKLKLISDDIIKIIPYKEIDYGHENFFAPFYQEIKNKLKTEEILPAKNKSFAKRQNAYWADSPDLANLFTNEQLAQLVDNPNAKWVFVTIGKTKEKELTEYIDGGSEQSWYKKKPNLIVSSLDFENNIANLITSKFIEKQPKEWLHNFYEYLSGRKSYHNRFKTKPIFIDSDGMAVAAFEKLDTNELHAILFLPQLDTSTTYRTINPVFLENEDTKKFILDFGIKDPDLKDDIYNRLLPLYDKEVEIDAENHFTTFFKYWKNEGQPEELINLINSKPFIIYKTNESDLVSRGFASDLYYPSEKLEKYFGSKPSTKFIDLEKYHSLIINEKDQKVLKDFFLKLGVNDWPKLIKKETIDEENNALKNNSSLLSSIKIHKRKTVFSSKIRDINIDGFNELMNNFNDKKSVILWEIIANYSKYYTVIFEYAISSRKTDKIIIPSHFIRRLQSAKWLLSNNDKFVAPNEITVDELAEGYESNPELESILGFKTTKILTEAERIASKFKNEEEAEEARNALEEKRRREKKRTERSTFYSNTYVDSEELDSAIKSLEYLSDSVSNRKHESDKENTLLEFNEDDELSRGVDDLKKQLEIKKSRIDLANDINSRQKYSYKWFKAYLKLLTTYGDKQETHKRKSISFQDIKPYKTDNKYFLLCGASSYISLGIENADDFNITLVFSNGKQENITVEGVSKKGQDLLIYCRDSLPSNLISQFSKIFKVEIKFTPVIDLLDRLYRAFINPNYVDEWDNIKESIPSLNFIYGPPGTGKTTTICNRINDIKAKDPHAKFLVLTPTNKAADVVCKKLKDIDDSICAVRLSHPTDPDLEEYEIYRNTINKRDISIIDVVASTIHRLPYFEIQEIGLLFQYEWDYVIFDESSMTGLHYITFAIMALFKTNPTSTFIIAGDPKQIPPIIEIEENELENFDYQDENIYKMMNLGSFNPKEQNIRTIDSISNLQTQYRSVPNIGQLFSDFSYSGLLNHNRTAIGKSLPEKFIELITSTVNFINIPLDKDNSIYKVNKLLYSSYHLYCSILVSEIIKYFDDVNKNEKWTIGVISPYKAQAILLNKLITSFGISDNVKVTADTVHGFQGDECDIVFFVCNPNNYFFSNHEKALLSKEYIYNVAISRARDYLIVLHPYSSISNNDYINKIINIHNQSVDKIKILNTADIEAVLFKDSNYIEDNSYVSGHDNVNIFGLSEMKYFIKINDTAIDIQLINNRES